jgi:hypothetical protein
MYNKILETEEINHVGDAITQLINNNASNQTMNYLFEVAPKIETIENKTLKEGQVRA